jgi:hypothetical protein
MDCFDENIIGDRVTIERFQDTIFRCSKICQSIWSMKRIVEEKDPMEQPKKDVIFYSQFLVYGVVLFILSGYGDMLN